MRGQNQNREASKSDLNVLRIDVRCKLISV